MNRFDREHIDGLGDGLSLSLGILTKARSLDEARAAVRDALLLAREAKDRDNLRALTEMVSSGAGSTPPAP